MTKQSSSDGMPAARSRFTRCVRALSLVLAGRHGAYRVRSSPPSEAANLAITPEQGELCDGSRAKRTPTDSDNAIDAPWDANECEVTEL